MENQIIHKAELLLSLLRPETRLSCSTQAEFLMMKFAFRSRSLNTRLTLSVTAQKMESNFGLLETRGEKHGARIDM